MNTFTIIKEGLRFFKATLHAKKHGFTVYEGDANSICKAIVSERWNGSYFETGKRHYDQFWTRDIGMCASALINLGHREKLLKTLNYAMNRFDKAGKITTCITPDGKPYDFPRMAVDSLPMLIHAIVVSDAHHIMIQHKDFLEKQIDHYFSTVFNPQTSMVKMYAHFSSMKDMAIRRSSTYDNCMVYMLQQELNLLGFHNPFKGHDIKAKVDKHLWNGSYYYEDMRRQKIVTGDANTFPFWTGMVHSKAVFKKCMESIIQAKLDVPWPLKYTARHSAISRMSMYERFAGDYERDTIWMHLGMCYLDCVAKYYPSQLKKYMDALTKQIEENHNFLEVFTTDGKPFETHLHKCEEGMLWACKYLELRQ